MLCSMVDIVGSPRPSLSGRPGRATPVRAGGTARRAAARQVRRAVRDPVPSRMPLHLVTGPANAAKARRALDAQRAGAGARQPARRPAAGRRRALPPRARRGRASSSAASVHGLRPAPGDDRPSRRAPRPPARRARARARRRRGRRADRPARAGRLGGDRRLPARAPAPRRRARGAPGRPRALVARAARLGGAGPGRGPPTPRTSGRSTAPTATRWPASAAPTPCCTRGAALDALRLEPGRWGGTPVVLYGFDDLTPLAARRGRDARRPRARRRPGHARPRGRAAAAFGGRGEAVHVLRPGRRRTRSCRRAPSTTRRLAGGAAPPRARLFASEDGPPSRGRAGRRRRAAAGRRRARRARARRRAGRAAARAAGVAPEEIAVVAALAGRGGRARRAGLRRGRHPGRASTAACPRATPRSAAAVVGLVRARAGRRHGRRPPRLAARARATSTCRRWPTAWRPRRAGPGVADAAGGARALGGGAPDLPARRARPACATPHARGPGALRDAPRRRRRCGCSARAAPRRRPRSSTGAETLDARVAAALRARARRARRPRRPRRRAVAGAGGRWPTRSTALEVRRGATGRCPARSPSRARWRSGRGACARSSSRGCRRARSRAPPRPEPFLGDADRRALNAASGLRLRLHEDALRPRAAASSTRRSRARRSGSRSAGTPPTTTASPRVPSLFVDDVRDLFAPSLWDRAAPLGARRSTARADARRRRRARRRPRRRPLGAVAHCATRRSCAALARARRVVGLGAGGVGGLPGALVRRALPAPGRARGRPRAAAPRRPRPRGAGGGRCARVCGRRRA